LLVVGVTGIDHAAQLELAGEALAEKRELVDEILADLNHGFLGSNGAVGLDADKELRHIRVRH
jgi:hypothetical protein